MLRASVYQGPWQAATYQGAWQIGDGYNVAWDQVWLYDHSATNYTDYTDEVNNATPDDFFTLGPGASTVDDSFYLGSSEVFDSVKINITTQGNGNWVIVKEYWNGVAWVEFVDVITDIQTDWKSSGWSEFTFTPNVDWATVSVDGAGPYYYMRFRADSGNAMTDRPGGGNGRGRETESYAKIMSDTITFSESTSKSIGKALFEGHIHDQLEGYTHDELESYTHDELEHGEFISEATVTMAVGKVFADSITFSELFSTNITTSISFAESFSLSESILFNVGKVVTESMNFSEAFTKAMAKPFTDAVAITEIFDPRLGLTANLADALVISDVIVTVAGYVRGVSDSQTIADSNVFAIGKAATDAQTIVDSFARVATYVRSLTDSQTASDSISKAIATVLSDALAESDVITSTTIIHTDPLASQKDIASLLSDPNAEVLPWMPWVAIGDDDTPFDDNLGTELWGEIHRKRGEVTVTANTYFVRATFGQDEPTGDDLVIREIGIFDAASEGVMGKRWVLSTGVDKDNVDEIVVECAVTILHGEVPSAISPSALNDAVSVGGESISFQLTKNVAFVDSMAISDGVIAKELSKVFSDAMPITDSIVKGLSIAFAEDALVLGEEFGTVIPGGSIPTPPIDDSFDVQGGCANGLDLDEVTGHLYMADNAGVIGDGVQVFVTTVPITRVGYGAYSLSASNAPNDVVLLGGGGVGYAAMVNYANFDIFDVTDPTNPFHAATTSCYGSPYRVQTQGNYAYTAGSGGISVFDISNPLAPSEIWNSVVDGGLALGVCDDLWLDGNYLYSGDYLWVLDITDPTNPSSVYGPDPSIRPRRLMSLGNYLYMAHTGAPRDLVIVDISDPSNPTSVNVVSTTNYSYSVFVAQKGTQVYAFVGNYTGDAINRPVVEIFNVTNPLSVSLVATVQFGDRLVYGSYWMVVDLFVDAAVDNMYVGETNTDLHFVDISALPSVAGGGASVFGESFVDSIAISDSIDTVLTPAGGDTATFIDNPNKGSRFPADDVDDSYNRQAWVMRYYDGRIYIGSGNAATNPGPLDMWQFDSVELFTNEQLMESEHVYRMRELTDGLYIVSDDATTGVGSDGTYYYRASGGAVVNYENVLPLYSHAFDMALYSGEYYVTGTVNPPGLKRVMRSATKNFAASVALFSEGDVIDGLAVTNDTMVLTALDTELVFIALTEYLRYDGVTLTHTAKDMFPGVAFTIPRKIETYDGDKALYLGLYGYFYLAPYRLRSLYEFEPATGTITEHFAAYNVRDFIVRGSTVYVLTGESSAEGPNHIPAGIITGRIWESNDMMSWSEIATFTVPAPPATFELMDDTGVFYVGLGGVRYSEIWVDSGAIHRIEFV